MIFQKHQRLDMDYRRTLPFYMNGNMQEPGYYERWGQNPEERSYYERNMYNRNRQSYYPERFQQMNEEEAMQDLEYLQQMYPAEVKRYQKKIANLLDKIDYRDSMIYDEYPDKLALRQLANRILSSLKKDMEEEISEDNWDFIENLIYVLLFYEIYKRRRKSRNSFYNF